jgi:hypothetical protein
MVTIKKIITCLGFVLIVNQANAACQNPAPRPLPFNVPYGQNCPHGYSQSGSSCAPSSSSARYSFVVGSGQGCPGNYVQQGPICIANVGACYAYFSGGGNCPSGYSQQGPICISN